MEQNNKIIVTLFGGLGNQMFQYAFGRHISNLTNRKLILDTFQLERRDREENFIYRNYDLDIFNLTNVEIVNGFSEPAEVIVEPWDDVHRVNNFLLTKTITSKAKNLRIEGYWASPKYFNTIDFDFKDKVKDNKLLNDIRDSESVMLNIRRADFIDNEYLGLIGRDYIEKGLSRLADINTKCFIFSDDIDWCRENIGDLGYIVDHSYKGYKFSNYLQLMSNCKYFIIPNSTFAWWAAYISKSKKAVYYPDNWIKNPKSEIVDIFPKDWIRIK